MFEAKQAFLEYKQSVNNYESSLIDANYGKANSELKEQAYKVGAANLSEVVQASLEYAQRHASMIRAKTSYFVSLVALDKVTAYNLGLVFPQQVTTLADASQY